MRRVPLAAGPHSGSGGDSANVISLRPWSPGSVPGDNTFGRRDVSSGRPQTDLSTRHARVSVALPCPLRKIATRPHHTQPAAPRRAPAFSFSPAPQALQAAAAAARAARAAALALPGTAWQWETGAEGWPRWRCSSRSLRAESQGIFDSIKGGGDYRRTQFLDTRTAQHRLGEERGAGVRAKHGAEVGVEQHLQSL